MILCVRCYYLAYYYNNIVSHYLSVCYADCIALWYDISDDVGLLKSKKVWRPRIASDSAFTDRDRFTKKYTNWTKPSKSTQKQAQKSPKIRKKMKEKARICSKDIKKWRKTAWNYTKIRVSNDHEMRKYHKKSA